jgi:hypothetical protein
VIDDQRKNDSNAEKGKKRSTPLHHAEEAATILATNDLQVRANQLIRGRKVHAIDHHL